jgi:hypothetical protein
MTRGWPRRRCGGKSADQGERRGTLHEPDTERGSSVPGVPRRARSEISLRRLGAVRDEIISAVAVAGVQEEEQGYELRRPLRDAGVDLHDEGRLLQILRTNEQSLAVNAAYVLGFLPRTNEVLRGLQDAAQSDTEELVLYSINSLLKLNDKSWVPALEERLPKIRSPFLRLQAAGSLARAGSYVGWPMVREELLDPGIDKFRLISALNVLMDFDGAKDPGGRPLDLVAELNTMLPKVAPVHRKWFMQEIDILKKKHESLKRDSIRDES